jgi:hypothetical protein
MQSLKLRADNYELVKTKDKGRYHFSLSTYNGTEVGCDGKPYLILADKEAQLERMTPGAAMGSVTGCPDRPSNPRRA